jgi:hypothetical protein
MAERTMRPGRVHRETVREAGMGSVSVLSVVAGVLCAYGTFALVAALAGGLLDQFNVDTEFRSNDWTGSGAVAGVVSALVLLVAYLFGGYVAGRMARRLGGVHGLAVAVLSLVLGAVAGAVVSGLSDNSDVTRNLRSIGVPTTRDQVSGVAVAAVLVSLGAILVGGFLGGVMGERWHTRLARRAADPDRGPAAEARRRAEREDEERPRRIAQDELVRRELDREDVGLRAERVAAPTSGATSTSDSGWTSPDADHGRGH